MNTLRSPDAGSGLPAPTQKLFHIHADIMELGEKFQREILETLRFTRDNFLTEQQIASVFERRLAARGYNLRNLLTGKPPEIHWTLKTSADEAEIYRTTRDAVERYMAENIDCMDTTGYIEAESVQRWDLPPSATFDPSVEMPFLLRLKDPTPRKEAEVHFSFIAEEADPRLLDRLVEIGMYAVVTPKSDNEVGVVLTAQGTHEHMSRIVPELYAYVLKAGGYGSRAKILEERINLWRETKGAKMAPVIADIE